MNTASRMESTGIRGRIQCSRETAELLRQSGKEHWITEREEKVHAKGKGEMQTYFVSVRQSSENDAASSGLGSVTGLDADDDSARDARNKDRFPSGVQLDDSVRGPVENDDLIVQALEAKKGRLVDWNTEILAKQLKAIVVRRAARRMKKKQLGLLGTTTAKEPVVDITFDQKVGTRLAIDEVKDIITLPQYDSKAFAKIVDPDSIEIPEIVLYQLKTWVTRIADLYQPNSFHNFGEEMHYCHSRKLG